MVLNGEYVTGCQEVIVNHIRYNPRISITNVRKVLKTSVLRLSGRQPSASARFTISITQPVSEDYLCVSFISRT
jgi:hypothetical protein